MRVWNKIQQKESFIKIMDFMALEKKFIIKPIWVKVVELIFSLLGFFFNNTKWTNIQGR